jgi:hypothetical protein
MAEEIESGLILQRTKVTLRFKNEQGARFDRLGGRLRANRLNRHRSQEEISEQFPDQETS